MYILLQFITYYIFYLLSNTFKHKVGLMQVMPPLCRATESGPALSRLLHALAVALQHLQRTVVPNHNSQYSSSQLPRMKKSIRNWYSSPPSAHSSLAGTEHLVSENSRVDSSTHQLWVQLRRSEPPHNSTVSFQPNSVGLWLWCRKCLLQT